jgi:hypothetical protein
MFRAARGLAHVGGWVPWYIRGLFTWYLCSWRILPACNLRLELGAAVDSVQNMVTQADRDAEVCVLSLIVYVVAPGEPDSEEWAEIKESWTAR